MTAPDKRQTLDFSAFFHLTIHRSSMNAFRSCLAIGAVMCLSSTAQAVTLNFNDLHYTGQLLQVDSQLSNYQGYKIGCESACLQVIGTALSVNWSIDPAGAAVNLPADYPGATIGVSRTNGAAFNLVSMDMADFFNRGYSNYYGSTTLLPTAVRFTFAYATGGFAVKTVYLDDLVGAETVNFSMMNITSFSMIEVDTHDYFQGFQFDNMVVTAAAAVPEPASWALLLGGLGAIGAIARRRRA